MKTAAATAQEAAVYQEDEARGQRVIAEVEGRAGDEVQPIEQGLEFRTYGGRRAVVVSVYKTHARIQVFIGPRRHKVARRELEHIRQCLVGDAPAQRDL